MTDSCYHCGQPATEATWSLRILDQPRQFCCPACLTVAQSIVELGLTDFYRFRTQVSPKPEDSIPAELQLYDRPDIQQDFIRCRAQWLEVTLLLEGVNCAACGWLIEKSLYELQGIKQIQVNITSQQAQLLWDGQQLPLSRILARLSELGFKAKPHQPQLEELEFKRQDRQMLLRLGVAGIGMMQIMTFSVAIYAGLFSGISDEMHHYLRWVSSLTAVPVLAYSAQSFFINAWKGLKAGRLVMDFPVSVAMSLAVVASLVSLLQQQGEIYFDSLVMFTFFLLTGRFLEMRARRRASRGLYGWYSLLPLLARRLNAAGDTEEVPLASLQAGDRLLVRPGEAIAADGQILRGETSCNEAMLTGESLPVRREPGARVLAGSINIEGVIELQVSQTGSQTRLAQIQTLLASGQQQRPYGAQLVDKLSGWFISAVLIAAALTWFIWQFIDPAKGFWAALSVLVVTCPCALSLATPAALTCAIGGLSQRGVLVRQGQALELLPAITRVVFDKTGTLTTGQIQLAEVRLLADWSETDVLQLAARLEQDSGHPIARAFHPYLAADMPRLLIRNQPGLGVSAEQDGVEYRLGQPAWFTDWHPELAAPDDSSWLLLAARDKPLAWFRLEDQLRPGVEALVQHWQQVSIPLSILSGDPSANAQRLAQQLGIDDCHWGCSPEDKLQKLLHWQQQGERILMVGDGINDGPVLAAAWCSASVSEGTELAKTQSDLILLTDRMQALFEAWRHASKTRRIVAQNLAWSALYNFSVLPLAAMGKVPPYMAAIGMSLSSLLVVLNALRLDKPASSESESGK